MFRNPYLLIASVVLLFGVLGTGYLWVKNNAETKERLQTIEGEAAVRDRVIEGVRTAPKSVKEALDYLDKRK